LVRIATRFGAAHCSSQATEAAAGIAEREGQARHDDDDDGDDLGDRPLDGLEDLLQGLFPWHRRTGRMGGRGEHETDGKGRCGGRHAAIAARKRADHEDSPVLVWIAGVMR